MSESSANAIVDSTGTVLIVPPVRMSHRCQLDRTNWPRDVATCLLKLGSWTYDGNRLNVSLYGGSPVSPGRCGAEAREMWGREAGDVKPRCERCGGETREMWSRDAGDVEQRRGRCGEM